LVLNKQGDVDFASTLADRSVAKNECSFKQIQRQNLGRLWIVTIGKKLNSPKLMASLIKRVIFLTTPRMACFKNG